MVRIRSTKRPAPPEFVLHPSRVRMFLVYVVVFALAILFGSGIRWLFNHDAFNATWLANQGPVTAVIIAGGAAFMSLTEYTRWTMRVTGGDMLEGPAGVFGDRLAIDIHHIDWTLTRRSLRSWLKIGNAIYGVSRQRILVSPWFFPPSQFREMLDRIGYTD